MTGLVLSPSRHQQHLPLLDNPGSTPTVPVASTRPSAATLLKWQHLPPLLSRLPVALLASSQDLPTPVSLLPSTQASLSTKDFADGDLCTSVKNNNDEAKIGYTESHLPAIDQASLALHHALYNFKVLDLESYATSPYEQAFNWHDLRLPLELEREWYIVAFRSVRRKGADTALLYQADRDAHEEAVTAGGLLLYWYGAPNEAGENLATCIWQSRQHALLANRNPKHAIAARLASATYDTYKLERYVLQKKTGEEGVTVTPWQGGDVGY